MKKISILVAIALMAIIYSCGNSGQGSNEQNADSLATAEQAEPQITLTVKSGEVIEFGLGSKVDSTTIRIVSGDSDTSFTVGTKNLEINYQAGATTMTIYGDITKFDCYQNDITALDVSQNKNLTYLSCGHNKLKTLDLSKNTELTDLSCGYNEFSSLDLSNNKKLKFIACVYVPFDKDGLKTLPDRKDLESGYIELGHPDKDIDMQDMIKKNWRIEIPTEVRSNFKN